MQVTAIVSEYNTFHNGHRYHIEETWKKTDNSFIMAIMSGNFVQRGEPAILEKRKRAEIAVKNGVDLVVELPAPWATASAERFARGAVYIAHQAGIVDNLSFGCEDEDISTLEQIARVLCDKVYSGDIKKYYDDNMCSYPEARAAVVSRILGKDCSGIMMKPNNILAIEYIKAIIQLRSDIKPIGIKRSGAGHDSDNSRGNITSAMNIRNLMKTGRDYTPFIPENSIEVLEKCIEDGTFPALYSNLEASVIAHLRKMKPSDFIGIPDVSEGIEHRIIEAVRTSVSLSEIFDKVKTKRYTHSRIRRIILSSFLGIKTEDVIAYPPYIRVLALNDNGRMMLKEMKNKYFVPVVMKYGDVKYLDDSAKRIFNLESTVTDLYNLALPSRRVCGTDMTDEIIYIPGEG